MKYTKVNRNIRNYIMLSNEVFSLNVIKDLLINL